MCVCNLLLGLASAGHVHWPLFVFISVLNDLALDKRTLNLRPWVSFFLLHFDCLFQLHSSVLVICLSESHEYIWVNRKSLWNQNKTILLYAFVIWLFGEHSLMWWPHTETLDIYSFNKCVYVCVRLQTGNLNSECLSFCAETEHLGRWPLSHWAILKIPPQSKRVELFELFSFTFTRSGFL